MCDAYVTVCIYYTVFLHMFCLDSYNMDVLYDI